MSRDLQVTAVDIVPGLVARAQERARREGLDISFDVGNAEALDFDDDSFDVVLSSFGAPFAWTSTRSQRSSCPMRASPWPVRDPRH